MKTSFAIPTGTRDILPAQIPLWQKVESMARIIFAFYGYQEIRTPLLEETELFARSMGEATDVVQKQMLNVQSQKGGDADDLYSGGLCLRPEGTASIVRSYIENNFDKKEGLSKLFYIGAMFRGERPQKGRLRQFHQIGVEAIGQDSFSAYLDAEVIGLSVYFLRALGLTHFELKINTLGTSEDKDKMREFIKKELKGHLPQLCSDCQKRFDRNVFRILDCKNKTCVGIVQSFKFHYDWLCPESFKYFESVKKALKLLEIPFQEEPTLVRGLDYYTHTVFEISDSSLGSQNALGAGGRYNGLISQLGGADVPAVGFALGVERILLAMPPGESEPKRNLDVFLIALDEESFTMAFRIADKLRLSGIKSDLCYRISSVKSLMRGADKSGAPHVIIIGENERQQEKVTLKNMIDGIQQEISVAGFNCQKLIECLSRKG